jgi:4'-phosphopantetheinyl transferase
MWTMKEAYTKALGMGLGFDFSRIEYDVEVDVLRVDGAVPSGWHFDKFVLQDGPDIYQGVVAEYREGTTTEIVQATDQGWLMVEPATMFIEQTILNLSQ